LRRTRLFRQVRGHLVGLARRGLARILRFAWRGRAGHCQQHADKPPTDLGHARTSCSLVSYLAMDNGDAEMASSSCNLSAPIAPDLAPAGRRPAQDRLACRSGRTDHARATAGTPLRFPRAAGYPGPGSFLDGPSRPAGNTGPGGFLNARRARRSSRCLASRRPLRHPVRCGGGGLN
jgi:hypothetical protein